jgi:integrase
MAKTKLTAPFVDRAKAPKSGRVEYFDTLLPGFALRVTDKGTKSWVVFYRIDGKQVRRTLGKYPALDLAKARQAARESLELAAKGTDARAVARERKTAASRARRNTVAVVVEQFIERHAKLKTRSWQATDSIFRRHVLPVWGDRPIDSITRRDVHELLDGLVDRDMPVMANRVLAHVRKAFNWALDRGILDASPIVRIQAPAKESPRDRTLSDDEIRAAWSAFEGLGDPFGPMFKLLLVTGQRRDEVARMSWTEIEGDLWTIPRERAKSDRAHSVPLSPLAMEILEGLRRRQSGWTGEFVFSTRGGQKPVSGYSKARQRAGKLCDVADWTLHDLRRTAATGMAQLGISPEIIGRVLNHAPKGVTAQVYNRHTYLNEKRRAFGAWSQKIESIVRPSDDATIVPLRARPTQ